MNIFEHETQYRARLCEDVSDQDFALFREFLTSEWGAQQVDEWWGVGGSQEISWVRFQFDAEIITVQSETYFGIEVFGPQVIVDAVLQRVQQKLQKSDHQ